MKRISLLVLSLLLLSTLTASSVVRAQSTDTLDGGTDTKTADATDTTSDTTDQTNTQTASVPDTGFAPTQNKMFAQAMVFIGGAALGGALGFGIVQIRKKSHF